MNMMDNPKLTEIFQRKLLEFSGLTPDEINQIMEFEKQKAENLLAMGGGNPMMQQPGQPMPGQPPQGKPQQLQPLINQGGAR